MTEGDKSEPVKFPEIKLPESVSWQSIQAGNPEEPLFEGGAWPTKGMLRIMGQMRQVHEVAQSLRDYCQTLPGSKPLEEIITAYNKRFDGKDGDPEGWIGIVANWLASEGGNHKKVDAETEQVPLVRKFTDDFRAPIARSFARECFLKQVLGQLMPARS